MEGPKTDCWLRDPASGLRAAGCSLRHDRLRDSTKLRGLLKVQQYKQLAGTSRSVTSPREPDPSRRMIKSMLIRPRRLPWQMQHRRHHFWRSMITEAQFSTTDRSGPRYPAAAGADGRSYRHRRSALTPDPPPDNAGRRRHRGCSLRLPSAGVLDLFQATRLHPQRPLPGRLCMAISAAPAVD